MFFFKSKSFFLCLIFSISYNSRSFANEFKKLVKDNTYFKPHMSVIEDIKGHPDYVCNYINKSVHDTLGNYVKYRKKIPVDFLSKILRNYSYCFDSHTIKKMFNTVMANNNRVPNAMDSIQSRKDRLKPFIDFEAARIIYLKFDRFLSEEQFALLYEYALVYDIPFSECLYNQMYDKIYDNPKYVCNFANYSVLGTLNNSVRYKRQVPLEYLNEMLSKYEKCFLDHTVQKMFDIVLPTENKLSSDMLQKNYGSKKRKPYVDFEAAKSIFIKFKDFLNDKQLGLLYEYAMVHDILFAQELDLYFSEELNGYHHFSFLEYHYDENNLKFLKEKKISIL